MILMCFDATLVNVPCCVLLTSPSVKLRALYLKVKHLDFLKVIFKKFSKLSYSRLEKKIKGIA